MVGSTGMVNWPFASKLDSLLSACGIMATWGGYRIFDKSVVCV